MTYDESRAPGKEDATEPAVDTKAVEAKAELEKLPPILFAYRDNDLFREYVGGLVKAAESSGRKVETQVFPQGTPEEEIKKWGEEHQKDLEGKQIVCDRTFRGYGKGILDTNGQKLSKIMEEKYGMPKATSANLDFIFNDATQRTILGERVDFMSGKNSEQGYEQNEKPNKQAFLVMLGRILEKPKNMPEKVYIAKMSIVAHEPFSFLREKDKDGLPKPPTPEQITLAAETIKKWLVESGIPDDSIEVVENFVGASDANKAENWLVADRHSARSSGARQISVRDGREWKEIPHNVKLLQLPIEDFYQSARDEGLLQPRPGEIEKALGENFQKMVLDVRPEKK